MKTINKPLTLAQKIIKDHFIDGSLELGEDVGIRIDQTLTQDATGTMAFLQFEALGIPKVKTERSVSYVDHNMLQSGFENMDDHVFLQSIAAKFGAYFSKPGNGICHQVHLERFGVPGKTLLGSDSHTPTCGGLGMIAIGAGGLDIAVAMGGRAFYTKMPKILGIKLSGNLKPWVSAKDVILEVLRRIDVKGGVGKILEYFGPGIETLSVPERASITNMGAETGATTSIFPSDSVTRKYLEKQGREGDWKELMADPGAEYDEVLEIDLGSLEPLVAQPSSPGNVVTVKEIEGLEVKQVIIGSCTNSSIVDMTLVAMVLKNKKVHPIVSLSIVPGSRQVLTMLASSGALFDLYSSGARLLETGCDGCIGMGSSPATGINSVRTFNRNFPGRSGTKGDNVYLVSPEVAVATALSGKLTDPRSLGEYPEFKWPEKFIIDDTMVLPPSDSPETVEVIRGPNIKPIPLKDPLPDTLSGEILLHVEDNITTDDIMPAGAKILPLRSNIPAISEYVFAPIDPLFASNAKEKNGGFIIGGENYGQGSSREHAALAPMYLGIKAVITKSFARIHRANLINFGIVPLQFQNKEDFKKVESGDVVELENIRDMVKGINPFILKNKSKNIDIPLVHDFGEREKEILLAGGTLAWVRSSVSS